jgi:hypothetical protein
VSKRHRKAKKVRADDVIQAGPLRIARFGRFVQFENLATEEQRAAYMEHFAEKHTQVCAEIDELIRRIEEAVPRFDALSLLHRAYWEYLPANMGIASEVELKAEALGPRFVLEYLQDVICAVRTEPTKHQEPSEQEWDDLTRDTKALLDKIQHEYFPTHTAWSEKNDPDYDADVEKYSVPAQLHWIGVRGDRYTVHNLTHFRDLLSPHDNVFHELFGIGVEDFLQALDKITHAFSHGPAEAAEECKRFTTAAYAALEESASTAASEPDWNSLLEKVIAERGWEGCRDRVQENFFGFGLFDLDELTQLPSSLLDALSWLPGEDSDFLAQGPFRGWPLRVPPTQKRPFCAVLVFT